MRAYRNTNTATESLVSRLNKMSLEERFAYHLQYHDIMDWTPFVIGNSKVYAHIFDTLAVYTCPNHADCEATCYARKFQRMYAGCLMRRSINTYLAENDLDTLEKLIIAQLTHARRDIVRLHSSGDFFSQAYVDLWTRIAERFPAISFYTYTKTSWDFSSLLSLPNFNLVSSICPDGSINYGTLDAMRTKARAFHAPICPYRAGQQGNPHCGKECRICLKSPLVLFVQH